MRVIQTVPFLVTLVALPVGYFGLQCIFQDSCILREQLSGHGFSFLEPLYVFALYAIPAVFFLPFVSKKVFSIWMKFAIGWLLLSLYIISSSPETMNAWFYVFDYSRVNVARLFAIAFSSISLALILVATLATRKKH